MRQAAERAAANSPPDIRALLDSYARGVNQYIDQQRQSRLPVEFSRMRYKPRPWTPADTYLVSLYMCKTLTSTWKAKINRAWMSAESRTRAGRQMFAAYSPLDHFIVGDPPRRRPHRLLLAPKASGTTERRSAPAARRSPA